MNTCFKSLTAVMMRPSTLDIRTNYHDGCYSFMRDIYRCWKTRTESCDHRSCIEMLFSDLQQSLSKKQVRDIEFTMKTVTRPVPKACTTSMAQQLSSSSATPLHSSPPSASLTDVVDTVAASQQEQQPRQSNDQLNHHHQPQQQQQQQQPQRPERLTFGEFTAIASCTKCFGRQSSFHAMRVRNGEDTGSGGALVSASDTTTLEPSAAGPEVFLGGSCNPTTWRADVAIPTLDQLGISFYNPQVSHWTPDLIELEHRAKEKAKVLFFVLDSQTRSTAGAIEVAHIAGQNSKYLLLVLLPYSSRQKILNETLSEDEYTDLMSNQFILRQLVLRRGLPVLDSIPLALQRVKEVLVGNCNLQPPLNLASRLISLRRTFERVATDVSTIQIDLEQCQRALRGLGYPETVTTPGNLQNILLCYEEVTGRSVQTDHIRHGRVAQILISFEEFCIIDACVSILMLDFYEHNCTSPIKGTNLQQPPVYLTDLQAWNQSNAELSPFETDASKSPRKFVLPNRNGDTPAIPSLPNGVTQDPSETSEAGQLERPVDVLTNVAKDDDDTTTPTLPSNTTVTLPPVTGTVCSDPRAFTFDGDSFDGDDPLLDRIEARDVYLGGSCWLKTTWRQRWAYPLLKRHNLSYYVSALHESFGCSNNTGGSEGGEKNQQTDPQSTLRRDAAMLDACRIVIFAITNETRSLAPMTMAAHYIGLGYNVVLCVQMLSTSETSSPTHSTLSSSAIKDYNRGRAYLIDLAKRHGIPVFEGLEETFESVIKRLTSNCTPDRYST
uniref:Raw n=2 Tax=Anopheles triannulatus TaxID=58253 RepID=A0A2M4AEJ2_9DIPT